MRIPEPEKGLTWSREQTEEKISELEDSIIDQTLILGQFTPNHVHWTEGNIPLFFRLLQKMLVRQMNLYRVPTSHLTFNTFLEGFLRTQGLPGKVRNNIYLPEEGCLWPVQKALRFREIDYTFNMVIGENRIAAYVNTSRIEGETSLYQAFTPGRYTRSFDYVVHADGQRFINTMLAARVLDN